MFKNKSRWRFDEMVGMSIVSGVFLSVVMGVITIILIILQ